MIWVKGTVIKILIVLISFFCIDGGRYLLIISCNLHVVLAHNHGNDVEVPHQHHFVNFYEEENWLESFRYDYSCFNIYPVKFLLTLITDSQEYSDSIWQPPNLHYSCRR